MRRVLIRDIETMRASSRRPGGWKLLLGSLLALALLVTGNSRGFAQYGGAAGGSTGSPPASYGTGTSGFPSGAPAMPNAPMAPPSGNSFAPMGPAGYYAPANPGAPVAPANSVNIGNPASTNPSTTASQPQMPNSPLVPANPTNAQAPTQASVQNAMSAIGQLTPQQITAAMQALNISPEEALALKNQLSTGTLSPNEVQSLCARLGSSGMSGNQIQSMASQIGLSGSVLNQVMACVNPSSAQQPMTTTQQPAGAPVPIAAQQAAAQVSNIEQSFNQLEQQPTPPPNPVPQNLQQFGYSLFASNVSTFAPVSNVPIGDDYVVGPGDQLNLLLWGRLNENFALEVQRDGSIQIPQVGPLQVAGLKFGQAKNLVEDACKQITGVKAQVTMGQLRTIDVYVLGQVTQPGAYTVSALSRISNALAYAGGISKVGSLRHVELRRDNRVVQTIDFYDMLREGDNSGDERLQNGDVIFVPPIGPVVGLIGNVMQPAIYELKRPGQTLRGVLYLAAGLTPFSDTERVQVERVDNHQRTIVIDVALDQLDGKRFELHDGDLVKVYRVLPQHVNTVVLNGNVLRPGEYEWHDGMKVTDLLKLGQGVAPKTFFSYALLQRLLPPTLKTEYIPVNLGKAISGGPRDEADLVLRARDELDVFNIDSMRDKPTVYVDGEIRMPGTYALNEGMRVSDLIFLAGGLRDNAFLKRAQLARTEIISGVARHVTMDVNLESALTERDGYDPILKNNDQLLITTASNYFMPWKVTVQGRVMRPGIYVVAPGEYLSTVLAECGGFLPDSFPQGMVFTRISVQQMEAKRLAQAEDNLKKGITQLMLTSASLGQFSSSGSSSSSDSQTVALAGLQSMLLEAQLTTPDGRLVVSDGAIGLGASGGRDVILEDGDSINIPAKPSAVAVLGQVNEPTAIFAEQHLTVRDYIARAGGPTNFAATDQIYVIKADGSVINSDNVGKSNIFPLYSVISGGIMGIHPQAGDTIFIPEDINSNLRLQYAKDYATIIASAMQTVAIVAILGTQL